MSAVERAGGRTGGRGKGGWYVHLTQAEECFRISKSDLGLRPVFHQKTGCVEAHVLVCFLNLAV